ncbi:3-hydroxyisobutyrate dehydrogenase-like beta-hydroxyacid dehydrogenase [Mycobacterium sp. MAA66]|uniref:NAD(P)-dependent oxidoreductase n=1 Tax=Mycobacterium sp. MAA66 TaxID=3156297 RepID=UPI003513A4C8
MKIGFAGLGRMGVPMAAHLLADGHRVIAYDLYLTGPETLPESLRDQDIQIVASPAGLADADMSVGMLPNAAITDTVLFGPSGLIPAANADHIHVVMGTVGPSAVIDFAQRAANADVALADAPVSGSVSLAESGQLTAMVGADDELFNRVRPVLAAMTSKQFHVGPVGAGSAAKLAVNSVLAALNQGVAEALVMAEAGGVAPAELYEVLSSSAVAAPYVHYKRENFLDLDGTDVGFALALLHKDVSLGLAMAAEHALDLPQATTVGQVLDRALESGLGQQDMAAVLQLLRHRV